ncbi:MAG: hypothetical protein JXR49_14895 [Acidobacteria bacterium]|nr:hypothetical protein [Acidobacteriota bacterium]
MLIEKARRERKWGRFPILRDALEQKKIPDSYYGPTTVSDNVFNALERLIEITFLASENEDSIIETANSKGLIDMDRDLKTLIKELNYATSFFTDNAKNIQAIRKRIWEILESA